MNDRPDVKHYQVSLNDSLKTTLTVIRSLENIALNDPQFVQWVKNHFSNECGICLLKKVWQYVQINFRYVDDSYLFQNIIPYIKHDEESFTFIKGFDEPDEVVISPAWLIQIRKGDCDDFSLFIHTVLTIMKIPCQYMLLAAKDNMPTHIVVTALDTIIDGANSKFNVIPQKYNYYEKV